MLFSIIVPMYGVEAYVEETIQSVLRQGFSDFEILLVDDGAKDRSGEIADSYAREDSRITVLHKENGGVSSARNQGIRAAKGEYLILLDGDDLLLEGSLQTLAKVIEEEKFPDVIFQNFEYLKNGERVPGTRYHFDTARLKQADVDDVLAYFFGTYPDFNWSACMHVYRTAIAKENGIFFNEKMMMNEDGNWLLEVLLHARRFAATDQSMYLYRVDVVHSLTHLAASLKHYESSYTMYTRWFYYFKEQFQGGKSRNIMMGRLARGYVNIATDIYNMPKEERPKAVDMFEKHQDIVPYSSRKIHRAFYFLLKFFGVKPYLVTINRAFRLKKRLQDRGR